MYFIFYIFDFVFVFFRHHARAWCANVRPMTATTRAYGVPTADCKTMLRARMECRLPICKQRVQRGKNCGCKLW